MFVLSGRVEEFSGRDVHSSDYVPDTKPSQTKNKDQRDSGDAAAILYVAKRKEEEDERRGSRRRKRIYGQGKRRTRGDYKTTTERAPPGTIGHSCSVATS